MNLHMASHTPRAGEGRTLSFERGETARWFKPEGQPEGTA